MAASKISISFLIILSLILPISAQNTSSPPTCNPFDCGKTKQIKFPFSSIQNQECGLYNINCANSTAKIQLRDGKFYDIKTILYQANQVIVQNSNFTERFQSGICDFPTHGTLFPTASPLRFPYPIPVITFFRCNSTYNPPQDFRNYSCSGYKLLYTRPWPYTPPGNLTSESAQLDCPASNYPLFEIPNDLEWRNFDLFSELQRGFILQWVPLEDCFNCEQSGGFCGSNSARNFTCFCQRGADQTNCGTNSSDKKKIIIIAASVGGGLLILATVALVLFIALGWKFPSNEKIFSVARMKKENGKKVENFLKNYGPTSPTRYSYSELKKITNYFKERLGKGGYGSVFKGKLLDGRLVAVKILDESKGDGDEFINEVATISKTSHINIVGLLGFCSERSKRALIYEFMPNGSLEKFIFPEKLETENHHLSWEILNNIAVGVARGLEYLHRGCNTRILHFDIKPHNILLHQDFCPKISDFGLARLCPEKQSTISMTFARGTLGYLAPEFIYRSLGGVSSKSDVYSYGILLLEMVGGRKNVDTKVEKSSKIYFPEWVYSRLDGEGDLELGELTEAEGKMAKKMVTVGLWCIQTKPSDRPSMSWVVEMLEERSESLRVPSKHFLSFSPPSELEISSMADLTVDAFSLYRGENSNQG